MFKLPELRQEWVLPEIEILRRNGIVQPILMVSEAMPERNGITIATIDRVSLVICLM
jgi:hypothetical protein